MHGTYADKQTQVNTGLYVYRLGMGQVQKRRFTPFFELDGFFQTGGRGEKKAEKMAIQAKRKWDKRGTWATARQWSATGLNQGNEKAYFSIWFENAAKSRSHGIYLNKQTLDFTIHK